MIDVDAAKRWIKKETADEDALIGALVGAAVAHIEGVTGKYMSSRDFSVALRAFPCRYPYSLKFTVGPVTGIAAVTYDPADGSGAVALGDFRLVEGYGKSFNGALQPAFGTVFPATLDGDGVVRISGTAGYGEGEAPELDQAALMLVAHWYQNREAVNVGNITTELPLGVQALIGPYRPVGLA